jgi:hypothetical protein
MGDSILFPPTLSNSSMKITHGVFALASSADVTYREGGLKSRASDIRLINYDKSIVATKFGLKKMLKDSENYN